MTRKYGDFSQPRVAKALTKSMTSYLTSRLNSMLNSRATNDDYTSFDEDATQQAMRIHSGPAFSSPEQSSDLNTRNF